MTERIITIEDDSIQPEYMVYGDIEFPKYLVTRETYIQKLEKVREMMDYVTKELAQGPASEDAGDTHGQYHNEIAWYREQDLTRRVDLARSIGRGLDMVTVIENYDQVRKILKEKEIYKENTVTLSSILNIQYNDDPDDTEEIILVAPMDGGAKKGFVSVETPLAKAIEGKSRGDTAEFKVKYDLIKIKIL